MNILNYKWSALVAASLHGAFLVSFPSSTIISPPVKTYEIPLTPIPPKEDPLSVPNENKTDESTPSEASGGPAVPTLPPEEPPPPAMDRMASLVPVDRPNAIGPIATDLRDFFGGESGPGTGIGVGDGQGPNCLIKDLDRIPRATVQPAPHYPDSMRKDGIAGSVTVEFDVDSSGRVYRAEAVHSTNSSFVEPAVRAVLKWHFEPGRRHGRAVPFRMVVPVKFGIGVD